MKKSSLYGSLLCIFVFVLLLPLGINISRALNWCLHATDLGIYQQALYELSQSGSWNPYVSLRDIQIFNDHFDPVILLPAFFFKLSAPSVHFVLFFEWLISYFLPIFLILFVPRTLSWMTRILVSLSFLTSLLVLNYLTFPVHPTSWAVAGVALTVYYLMESNYKKALLVSTLLVFFKEYYPFCLISLGLGLLVFQDSQRQSTKKWGFVFIFLGLVFSYCIYILRPHILGPVSSYGHILFKGFLDHPFDFISHVLSSFSWRYHIWLFSPLLLWMWITSFQANSVASSVSNFISNASFIASRKSWIQALSKMRSRPGFLIFCFILPIILIQFIYGHFKTQYGAPLAGLWLGFICAQKSEIKLKSLLVLLVISLATGFSKYESFFNYLISKPKTCSPEGYKTSLNAEIKKTIGLANSGVIIASGGIIPALLEPHQQIYQLGLWQPKVENFQTLILCYDPNCDNFPFDNLQLLNFRQNCRPQDLKVLLDDDKVYLAQGSFSISCLSVK